jgi:Concanavalin A-like lectin/glucanases superfamily
VARPRWPTRPSTQTGLSAVLVVVMAGFVGAVWSGAVDLQPANVPAPRTTTGAGARSTPDGATGERAAPSPVPGVPPDVALWLTFDRHTVAPSGDLRFPDASGRWEGVEQRTGAERLAVVAGPLGRGRALSTPPRCPGASGCPTAVVQVADDDALDPAGAAFSFGATVRLQPDEVGGGGNVVQKGWFQAEGGQWTLNVDALDGHPSCVVEGVLDGAPTQVIVRSGLTVADGSWHRVTCHKTATSVTIVVDGNARSSREPVGTVGNAAPVVVAGSGLESDDEQLHGQVDDVFLRVDAE